MKKKFQGGEGGGRKGFSLYAGTLWAPITWGAGGKGRVRERVPPARCLLQTGEALDDTRGNHRVHRGGRETRHSFFAFLRPTSPVSGYYLVTQKNIMCIMLMFLRGCF